MGQPMVLTGMTFESDVIVNGRLVKAGTKLTFAPPPESEYKLVRADVLAWLHGEAPHPESGEWFGRPDGEGAYWWRSRLRKATLNTSATGSTSEAEHLRMQIGYIATELMLAGDKRSLPEIVEAAAKATRGQ